MKMTNLERAAEAMVYMEKGHPYSLHPEDRKRKLLDEVERICREMTLSPVVIDGLAVSHHGYLRTTRDVAVLASRDDGLALIRRLKSELGWKRYAEGFMNTELEVGFDICVEGERASPRGEEVFPSPSDLKVDRLSPIPVVALPDLIALKVMSGRAQDDADVVNLLKIQASRGGAICTGASRRLKTPAGRARLKSLAARAKEERRQ
jgi:hypothetical protein